MDKVVVITGASSGLGLSLTKQFAQAGSKLVLSDRTKENVEHLCNEFECTAVPADVTSEQEMENLAKQALEKWGKVDIWINNAGVWLPYAPADTVSIQDYRRLMEVNFFGLLYGSLRAAKIMKEQGQGSIIHILSVRPLNPKAGSAAYAASKAAAVGFTKTLRLELEALGISVVGVYPSRMKTNLFGQETPENYKELMDPDEVAQKIIDNLRQDIPQSDQIISEEIVEINEA